MRQEIQHKMTVNDLKNNEFGSFYKSYIDLCDDQELIPSLEHNLERTVKFLTNIPAMKRNFRYEEGKWSIMELIQHLIDTERVLSYRALRFARNDKTELPGYDHDDYVAQASNQERFFEELIEEFKTVRNSSILLFKSFNNEMLLSKGKANNSNMSVRAIGFILIGHCNHHCKVIKRKYL